MKRSEVKDVHEKSVLEAFKNYSASNGKTVVILTKPEPPDAIITIDGVKTWIEITDAFISTDHARSITSSISDDKEWIKSQPRLISVDGFIETLKSVAQEKYDKKSIQAVCRNYGPGILIVGCFSPFHCPIRDDLKELAGVIKDIHASNEKIFNEIYLYDYDYDYKPIKVV